MKALSLFVAATSHAGGQIIYIAGSIAGKSSAAGRLKVIRGSISSLGGLLRIKDILEDEISYASQVLIGSRDAITEFPAILMVPIRQVIVEETAAARTFRCEIQIRGYVKEQSPNDRASSLASLEEDIRAAIETDKTLGDYAINTRLGQASYNFSEPPVYAVTIAGEILLRQELPETTMTDACETNLEIILAELQGILEDDVGLSAYVEQVLVGQRESVTIFPCILIEPALSQDRQYDFGAETNSAEISVLGFVHEPDKERQIVGAVETKGILDLQNDVETALDAYRSVKGKAVDLRFKECQYDFSEYPVRAFALKSEVIFR